MSAFQITAFAKEGGALTKRIVLGPDGTLKSDGSECVMRAGDAKRVVCANLCEFAVGISECTSHEAIALGTLRPDLPDDLRITTKAKLNGSTANNVIARTGEFIVYRPGQPALALLDVDTKAMPAEVHDRIKAVGGFWRSLVAVVPELEQAGRVVRRSTSTGISRTDTGEKLPGSNGLHIYSLVQDGGDVERFLRTMHDRCWLRGFGWYMVGAGGQLLERSIVDRMVYAPERLVFEGAPVLDPPLLQDLASRQAEVTDGAPLDTVKACPPLTVVEKAQLDDLRAKDAQRLAPDCAKAKDRFVGEQADHIAKRAGITIEAARRIAARQSEGILLPNVVLPFDDHEFEGCSVAEVLADPGRFEGATLADPVEGPSYGRCKAKVMRRRDGTPWINSFAHGRAVYSLEHDVSNVEDILAKTPDAEAINLFIKLLADGAAIEGHDYERLRDALSVRCGINKRTIDRSVKAAREKQARQRRQDEQQQRAAARSDPRPRIGAPRPDAPWLPQMAVLNEVLGRSADPEPAMRDLEGVVTEVRTRPVATMHTLTARGSNEGETEETRLPAPEHPLLTCLDEAGLGELIERHIDYVDENGTSVHLAAPFVKHFLRRHDNILPTVMAVATMPMVLPDGEILSGRGLNRERHIVFRVPQELQALIPDPAEYTATAVAEAMSYLCDQWLVDVAGDYTAKCVAIAMAATIIERLVLPERPAFFISAGQRGGGKTTLNWECERQQRVGLRWTRNAARHCSPTLAMAFRSSSGTTYPEVPRSHVRQLSEL